jgi:predicted outer membrane repeat protein
LSQTHAHATITEDVVRVSNSGELEAAIPTGSGNASIALLQDISLNETLNVINFNKSASLTVYLDGRGFTLDASNTYSRCFFVIGAYRASVTMHNLTIVGGTANDDLGGGAAALISFGSRAASGFTSLIATHCSFFNNTSTGNGGALSLSYRSSISLISSLLSGNTAQDAGGAIYISDKTASLTLASSVLSDNVAKSYGGGIYATSGSIDVSDCTLSRNAAEEGGGGVALDTDGTSFVATNAEFISNSGGGYGGAIWVSSATAKVEFSKVTHNTAELGGGIYSMSGGHLRFEFVNISENRATANAGGVCVPRFTLTTK